MSATGRSDVRRADDAYMTPPWCVRRLLDVWRPRPHTILVEPAVGTGNIVRTVDSVYPGCDWFTWDVREVAPIGSHVRGSFLDHLCCDCRVSAVVTNPPYSLAEEFIRKARGLFPSADLAFLLRLNFLGSTKRLALWRDVGMPSVYVLPNRPSFTGGGTDSVEYAWFVWRNGCESIARVLAETPASERKSGAFIPREAKGGEG